MSTIVPVSETDLESRGEGVESGALEEDSGPDVAHVVEEAGDSEEGRGRRGIEKPERKSDVQYENMEELVLETREQIGTVLEVAAWKEEDGKQSYPGSARLVAWDPVFLNSSSQSTMTKSSNYDAVAGAGTIDAWVERTDTSTTDQNDEGRNAEALSDYPVIDDDMVAGASEELMRWDVYAGDFGGMRQVEVNENNGVKCYLPLPITRQEKAAIEGFGLELHFGIILRIRKLPLPSGSSTELDEDIEHRLVGILELPDFNAEVLVEGYFWKDGIISFEERKLVSGTAHANWMARFCHPEWRPNTSYELHASRSAETDRTDPYRRSYLGSMSYTVTIGQQKVNITGDLQIQSSSLFHFDDRMKTPFMQLSLDKKSVFRPPPSWWRQ